MDNTVSVSQARGHLTELFTLAQQGGERFVVERNGQPLGAIVSLADLDCLERLASSGDGQKAEQRAQQLAKKLGRRYTLPPAKAKRIKELVEKQDEEDHLTAAERRELKQLLKEHEELMVKRAQALGEVI